MVPNASVTTMSFICSLSYASREWPKKSTQTPGQDVQSSHSVRCQNPIHNMVLSGVKERLSGFDRVPVLCGEIHEVFDLCQAVCFKALHQLYLLFLAKTSLSHVNVVPWVCI